MEKVSTCTNCPAFMHGTVHKAEHGFSVSVYDYCLFWKWVSISAVMPTFPPETCTTGESLKKALYDPEGEYDLIPIKREVVEKIREWLLVECLYWESHIGRKV